ncbi:arsenate-mycothiol transferase ArsC [Herbaspirillum chlorophenolicum]
MGEDRFKTCSADSHHAGAVNSLALEQSHATGYPPCDLRSKNWDACAATDTVRMDFIIAVCDNAAGEAGPIWPG